MATTARAPAVVFNILRNAPEKITVGAPDDWISPLDSVVRAI
jgi:hypothetical protein